MAPRPQRWFFDTWALIYDLPWVQRAVYRPAHDAVLPQIRAAGCRTLLDVGCGTGQLAARLRRELPGRRIVGCDFSSGMLRQARARERGAWWVQGDAGRLPLRDAAFDAVMSTEAFHWFPDRRRALGEFRRVLRPGGQLYLALVNPRFALTGRAVHLLSRAAGEPFYWPTTEELRHDIAAAGFRVDRQVRLFRIPGAILFPSVLTIATARQRRQRVAGRKTQTRAGAVNTPRSRIPTPLL